MSTIFIAVQCCQCSTMQVKQQKKSSNKWNCVICNQKQSVRKVHAQGFMAKEVRKFVQGFNMSRQYAEENKVEYRLPPSETANDPFMSSNEKRRRNDWTEYLDPQPQEENVGRDEETGGFFLLGENDFVTESPKDMFKKPKLKNHGTAFDTTEANKILKPAFAKRNTNKSLVREATVEQGERQPRSAEPASKWSDYLTPDDDELLLERKTEFPDIMHPSSQGVLEIELEDEKVEEAIHPDFVW